MRGIVYPATRRQEAVAPRRRARAAGLTREQLGYVLVAPALVLVLGTIVIPVGETVALSLQTLRINLPDLNSGFNNFQNYNFLIHDPNFWSALRISALLVVANIVGCIGLGMGIALILNQAFFGRGVVRGAMLIPWAIPGVVVATLWRYMFNAQYGIINAILVGSHLMPSNADILGGPLALLSVIIAMVWRSTPFTSFLILAGLQTIPSELYEAAKIDGATPVQRFMYVTIPLVKSAVVLALIFRSLDAFREFDILYNLTAGGPGVETQNIALYTYKTYFAFLNFGYGATLAVVMAVLSAVAVFFFIRLVGLQLSSREG
jgi:multiple sugar transport system permease protein